MAATKTVGATAKAAPGMNDKSQMDGKASDLPDFSKWTAHQIGFAPYWKPGEPGAWCYMKIVAVDNRNPLFVRYHCTALKETECRRGPGNDNADEGPTGEVVIVKAGDAFSISVYHALREEFNFFLYARSQHGIDVPMKLTATKKVATKHVEGRKVWNWELLSNPEARPALEKHRDEFLKLIAGEAEREQLEEETGT